MPLDWLRPTSLGTGVCCGTKRTRFLPGWELSGGKKITGFDRLCYHVKYSERQRVGSSGFKSWLDGVDYPGPSERAHVTRD